MKSQSRDGIMILVFMVFVAMPAGATREFVAAGILLVARDNGSVLVLLGRDRNRPWYEMLGGRRQLNSGIDNGHAREGETAYETAIRECFEESRGFLSPDVLRRATDPSRFIRDGGFVFFLGTIDEFRIARLEESPAPQSDGAAAFGEIADYAWVPVENVLASNDVQVTDSIGRRIKVRRQLKSRLTRAREAGWL